MCNESKIQSFVDKFLAALHTRHLDQCEEILASLDELAVAHPVSAPWHAYLTGVLINERDQDWAQSERIFGQLCQLNDLDLALRGRVLIALGITYHYQGRWAEAIRTYERSLPIFMALGQPIDQVKARHEIAIAYQRGYTRGDFGADALDQALEYGLSALDLLGRMNDPTPAVQGLRGIVYNNLGLIYKSLQQWDKAIDCYQRDLAVCQEFEDRFGMGLSYGNLGEVYQQRGPAYWAEAREAYVQAWQLISEFDNLYEEAEVLTNLASLHRAMHSYPEALHYYTLSIERIESLRARISSEEARAGFFATVINTYAQAVLTHIEMGQTPEAFDLMERARARTFVEILAGHAVRSPHGVSNSLLTREQTLRAALQELYAAEAQRTESMTQLEKELDDVERQIRLIDAEYAAFHVVHPLKHDQIQRRLPADTVLLSYFVTGERLWVFVMTHHQLSAHELPIAVQSLQNAFDANGYVHRLLPGARGQLHKPWLLTQLYEVLIAPVVNLLRPQTTLCILPHGTLHYVPFQALTYTTTDGAQRYLVDDFQIVYAPSATVLLDYCRAARPSGHESGLAVGYNGAHLHSTETEASGVAEHINGTTLVGPAATRDALLAQARSVRRLHVACHGRFNSHAPLTSHLLLADGPLYVADVLQKLELQAELVVLSACDTGRSRILQGDELIGLVRAFIHAGAAALIVSLWPVDEVSTRILMERFYLELTSGQSKAAALRAAQQFVRTLSAPDVEVILKAFGAASPRQHIEQLRRLAGSERVFAHPYFWAPFILIGDWQ